MVSDKSKSKGPSSTSTALRERVREERRSVYRAAIGEAAERVFGQRGSAGARMGDVASEAGISLGTLYSVIDGKDSLLVEIYVTRMAEFFDCIRAARDAHEETLARHLAVLREGGRFFLDRPDFLRMCCQDGFAWSMQLPDETVAGSVWEEGASIPRELFERGIADGIYVAGNPDLLVRKMLALKQVELVHWAESRPQDPEELVLDRLEDQFVRAFCTDPPRV